MKILLIDDDKALQEEISYVLTKYSHTAICANDAPHAVQLVERSYFDFVLVDYKMPHHDGAWFMKQVNLPASTKAILMTAYLDRKSITAMFALGVAGYVIKPFDEEELFRHLDFHAAESELMAAEL